MKTDMRGVIAMGILGAALASIGVLAWRPERFLSGSVSVESLVVIPVVALGTGVLFAFLYMIHVRITRLEQIRSA